VNTTTRDNLSKWAVEWMATGIAPEYPTVYQGKAIAIYRYLADGEWHHAKEIALVIALGDGTTRNLMGALRKPFGLSVNTRKGYRLAPRPR